MIEAFRVVQEQTRRYSYDATADAGEAAYLEAVLELTKPPAAFADWDPLIAAPFRYPLPVQPAYQARFKPPFSNRNVLYCSKETVTALYEHAYHYLRERVHLAGAVAETGARTIFSLFIAEADVRDISARPDIARITARDDRSASHEYVRANPEVKVIGYPSCRDPRRRMNFAALAISSLGKGIGERRESSVRFEPAERLLRWIDHDLAIRWDELA